MSPVAQSSRSGVGHALQHTAQFAHRPSEAAVDANGAKRPILAACPDSECLGLAVQVEGRLSCGYCGAGFVSQ